MDERVLRLECLKVAKSEAKMNQSVEMLISDAEELLAWVLEAKRGPGRPRKKPVTLAS